MLSEQVEEEWRRLVKEACESSISDCPLIEDEVIVKINDYLKDLEARLAPSTEVFVVLDDSKAGYDAGGIFRDVFASQEAAEASLEGFDAQDRANFCIDKYTI